MDPQGQHRVELELLDTVPMTDPLLFLQMLAAGFFGIASYRRDRRGGDRCLLPRSSAGASIAPGSAR